MADVAWPIWVHFDPEHPLADDDGIHLEFAPERHTCRLSDDRCVLACDCGEEWRRDGDGWPIGAASRTVVEHYRSAKRSTE